MPFFDYIFGIGLAFAIWDAINCGANDVANAFATSVNSRALTMTGAMIIATAMELLGAMTLGTYNASTIRSGIIQTAPFNNNGGSLMLAMMCVVMSSSTFNFMSNKFGWATSSTHALVGALIGVGVASGAGVDWGYTVTSKDGVVSGQNGLGAVVASFVISPVLAGLIGSLLFTLVRLTILEREAHRSFRYAIYSVPFWYAFVAAFEAFLISWKSPRYPQTADNSRLTIAIFFGVFGAVAFLSSAFLAPFFYRQVWLGWVKLQLWHLPLMILPNAWILKLVPGLDETHADWDNRHLTGEAIPADEAWQWHPSDMAVLARKRRAAAKLAALENGAVPDTPKSSDSDDTISITKPATTANEVILNAQGRPVMHDAGGKPLSAWKQRKAYFKADMADPSLSIGQKAYKAWIFVFFIGTDREVSEYKADEPHIAEMHGLATQYFGKTEAVFKYLQILTSALASFSHGANDVALSVGPIATLYYYREKGDGRGSIPKTSAVLDWQLAVGALSLILGLWMYGYNMMRVLGNRLTFHSPTRGFCMEMGAAITVLIAARNGIPVSTTNCIVGATVGVGLAGGNWRGVNWKLFGFTLFTWIYTVPFTAIISGCLYALIAYSPKFDCTPTRITVPGGAWAMINGVNRTGTGAGSVFTIFPPQC